MNGQGVKTVDQIDGFTFFRSYREAVAEMDDPVKLEVLEAIIAYGLDGVEPTLSSPFSRSVFAAVKPNLDSSRESVLNGKRGGRPKKTPPGPDSAKPPFEKSESKRKEIEKNKNKNVNMNKKGIRADKPPAHTRFIPPTVEEVMAYCQERKNQVDPEKFVAFYESKGWMVGKNKMKDWKAAVRTWEKEGDSSGKSANPAMDHGQGESRWGKLQSVQLD